VIGRNQLVNSIFIKKNIAEGTNNVKLELDTLEQLFGVKKEDKSAQPLNSKANANTVELVSLIDPKRSYNLGIQLTSLRMPYATIKKGIIEMDETTLGPKLGVLMKVAPQDDELEQINNYDGDVKLLAEPEKFFYEIKDIAQLPNRLDTWNFKIRFEADYHVLLPDIESILLASKEMQESKSFLEMLTIILAMCNFLNAKGRKKNTMGFKLSSLTKLSDTKTVDNKSNLLSYLVEYVERAKPDLLQFTKELPNVIVAKRVSVASIKETLSGMNKSLNQVKKQLDLLTNKVSPPPEDKYVQIMQPFYDEAKSKVELAQNKFESAIKALEELAELFDEDKAIMTTKPEDFFTQVDGFFTQFEAARKKREEQKAKESKQRGSKPLPAIPSAVKKEGSFSENSTTTTTATPTATAAPQSKPPGGLVDNLEKSLRDASTFKKRGTIHLKKDSQMLAQLQDRIKKMGTAE
jgi:archaellum component FlaC